MKKGLIIMPERLILERAYVGLVSMVQNESNFKDNPESAERIRQYQEEQEWILNKIEELDD